MHRKHMMLLFCGIDLLASLPCTYLPARRRVTPPPHHPWPTDQGWYNVDTFVLVGVTGGGAPITKFPVFTANLFTDMNHKSCILSFHHGGGGGASRSEYAGWCFLTHTETQRGRLWTACGQRRVDSKNSQTTPATTSTSSLRQLLGAADAQTAHHATFSTAPTHQLLGSANAETTPARAPAAAADRKQQPDATCEGKNG